VGRLLIGHFSTRYKQIEPLLAEARALFAETTAVEDGDVYSIPLEQRALGNSLPAD